MGFIFGLTCCFNRGLSTTVKHLWVGLNHGSIVGQTMMSMSKLCTSAQQAGGGERMECAGLEATFTTSQTCLLEHKKALLN